MSHLDNPPARLTMDNWKARFQNLALLVGVNVFLIK